PVELAPVDAPPADAAPADAAPADAAPADATPADAELGDATSITQPSPTGADPSVTAPAPPPAIAPTTTVERSDPARDHAVESFTARRGFRMATAGTAVAAAGVAWLGVAGWMLSNDD